MEFIFPNRVLIIVANEFPDNIKYNLPETAVNIHDWVITTWTWERIDLIWEWIKRKREHQLSEMVVIYALFRMRNNVIFASFD